MDDVAPSLTGDTHCNPDCLVDEAPSQRDLFSGLGVVEVNWTERPLQPLQSIE